MKCSLIVQFFLKWFLVCSTKPWLCAVNSFYYSDPMCLAGKETTLAPGADDKLLLLCLSVGTEIKHNPQIIMQPGASSQHAQKGGPGYEHSPRSPEPPRSSARWLLTVFNYDSQELIWLLAVYPPSLPSMQANYAWVAVQERWTLLMALPLPLCSHYWGIWVVKWDHNWLLCHHWLCYKTLWARTQ